MNQKKYKKIAIIGAGIAGLSAAQALKSQFDVTVFEATDIAGGRVTHGKNNYPYDLGAFVLHGIEGNPMARLADQCGFKYQSLANDKCYLVDQNGELLTKQYNQQIFDDFESILWDTVKEFRDENTYSISDILNTIKKPIRHIPLKYQAWRKRVIACYFGLDCQHLSAAFTHAEEVLAGGNHMIVQGMHALIQPLSDGVSIRYKHKIKAVHSENQVVTILTSDEDVFSFDAVIVTVSLGTLKNHDIEFTPGLSYTHQQAIDHIDMGLLNKVIIEFKENFWPKQYLRFASLEPKSICPIYFNLSAIANKPALVGFVAGNEALEFEKLSDDAISERVLQDLQLICNKELDSNLIERVTITRWGQNPFTHGAYSCLAAPFACSSYADLARPMLESRFFFAGEATNLIHAGTVHGASLSGLRAAREIADLFQQQLELPSWLE